MSKPDRKSSFVWNVIERPDENNIVTCTLCKKRMKFFGNTTNLHQHLKRIHNYVNDNTGKLSEKTAEDSFMEIENSDSIDNVLNASEQRDNQLNSVDFLEGVEENRSEEPRPTKNLFTTKSPIKIPEKKIIHKTRPIFLKSYDDTKPCRTTWGRERNEKDEFDVFGEYIAMKLRNLDKMSCIYVQKAFNDVIFDAELGKYSVPQSVVEVNYVPDVSTNETTSSTTTTNSAVQILQGSTTSLSPNFSTSSS